MKRITVNTSKPYDIILENGAIKDVAKYITEKYDPPRRVCVMTDSSVGGIYGESVISNLSEAGFSVFRLLFPAGEHSKNLNTYANMLEALADEGMTRTDIIVALGGGIVGDLAGFVAGTYMRGIDYVFVPTSLMAIIDSSLGGKTGVNLAGGKNMTGMFWTPSLVISDPDVLETLSEEKLQDGLAEAIRSAVVSDGALVTYIEKKDYDYIIDRCISINKTLIEVDEKDEGLRQLLSFGHTLSHGIEKLSSYGITHGQAVAKGMVGEAKACAKMGYSKMDISQELSAVLEKLGMNPGISMDPEDLYRQTLIDKKIVGNSINIIVPDVIGRCSLRKISLEELRDFIYAACE